MTKTRLALLDVLLRGRETWVPVWTTGATLTTYKSGVFSFNRAGTTTDLQVGFDYFHVDASP